MIRSGSPRLQGYGVVAAAGLIAALAAGRPDLAALVTPLLVALAVGLTRPALAVEASVRLPRARALEGEELEAVATVHNRGAAARVELHLPTSPRLLLLTAPSPRGERFRAAAVPVAFWLGAGERRDVHIPIAAERWGVHHAGPPLVRLRDALGAS
jgi:uncharacterized protein (DUF58 family)